jgi:hypothetical protein
VIVPNVVSDVPPLEKNPVFLYLEDQFQKPYPFHADITVDITSTFNKKLIGMDAHQSQFYEWLPWTEGDLANVPMDASKRMDYLKSNWSRSISPEIRKSLVKWYGEKQGSSAKYAESFEICEYGKQPTEDEIRALFPMLNSKL